IFGAKRQTQSPLRYAGATPGPSSPPPSEVAYTPAPQSLGGAPAAHSVAATTGGAATAPDLDFDREQFLQHARTNFVNLQAAHDRRDLKSIRDFLTPEMYQHIEADVRAAGPAQQKIEVVTLN